MATRITARDLASMTQHWLGCPVDGYLGSGYGSDIKSLLQTPMASGLADGIIAKARQDIPLLLQAPPDAVNVYAEDRGMDVKALVFEIGGELVAIEGGESASSNESTPSVDLELSLLDTITEAGAALLETNINVTLPSQHYF